ncbi:hypothetical protein [Streptomyces carpinensis]|uniref:Uncharacterized protein n=1 Tax=Streptomyces carpinensis TaxID=66369 RepID=A0ABV1W9W7_9ACTN|nr:hypothetical protein [Streptomyces carpinensis]
MTPKKYRCNACRTTSPLCFTDSALHREKMRHRYLAHTGHRPDGERIIDVPVASLFDIPRGQVIATVILLLAVAAVVLAR